MERHDRSPLRPSVLYAGIEVVRECTRSSRTPTEALKHIHHGNAGRTSFDYPGASNVASNHGWAVFSDHPDVQIAFRDTLRHLIAAIRPVWIHLLPAGRARIIDIVDIDLKQCIQIAGLLSSDAASVYWWDALATLSREWEHHDRLQFGRDAERRAMARERSLLKGTNLHPVWVAIDDNAAGYDIQSWKLNLSLRDSPVEQYIEIKATSPFGTVHITRREWQFAEAHPERWELQIWQLDYETPTTLKLCDVSPHIPLERNAGSWSITKIPSAVLLTPTASRNDESNHQPTHHP